VEEYKAQLNQLEAELATERNAMALGYADPQGGAFHKASSVQLRNTMRTSDDEAVRRAAYEGLRSIGPAVAQRFAGIVKLRNRLASAAGYSNYYDMKVRQAEGFSLETLFDMLDGLEQQTRPIMEAGGQSRAPPVDRCMHAARLLTCIGAAAGGVLLLLLLLLVGTAPGCRHSCSWLLGLLPWPVPCPSHAPP
jgi:hypothetical protein